MTAAAVLLPAEPPRRATARITRWWAKAWVRAVEEAAYAERDLAAARTVSRSGRIGRIAVRPGAFAAAVEDARGLWAVSGTVPEFDEESLAVLVEVVAGEPGRLEALLAGDLPFDLVEHAEELGVELLPAGGELGSSCSCQAWTDPCVHALAVLLQLARQVDVDPLLLLHLRGLPRDDLLARLPSRPAATGPGAGDPQPDNAGIAVPAIGGVDADPHVEPHVDPDVGVDLDLDVAEEAALRARWLLGELPGPPDRRRSVQVSPQVW